MDRNGAREAANGTILSKALREQGCEVDTVGIAPSIGCLRRSITGGLVARRLWRLLIPLAIATLPCSPTWAQAVPSKRLELERYIDLEGVNDPQISPDRRRIVYFRSSMADGAVNLENVPRP